jgi:hypothetical protein
MLGEKAKTEGRGGGEFFSKEIRLMDMIILIKSLDFKYTVVETKVDNDLMNHLGSNCDVLRLAIQLILQPKCVEQKLHTELQDVTFTIKYVSFTYV